ncbi:MAG TPA: HDOD domain-containing protein [bacterium]|jgi:HD-like signal output (HDOD) protein
MNGIWLILGGLALLAGVAFMFIGLKKNPPEETEEESFVDDESAELPESVNPVEATAQEEVQEEPLEEEPEEEGLYVDIHRNYLLLDDITDEKYEQLKSLTRNLPELPHVAVDLLPVLSQPGAGMIEVSKIIQRDQAAAARLLRWVNSGFYGLERKVDSLHRAITLLGLDVVRSAVVYDSFNRLPQPRSIGALDSRSIWIHSSAVSVTAKSLSRRTRGIDSEVAATAGLLANIGLILMLITEQRSLETIIESAEESGEPMIGFEDEILGFNHQIWSEIFLREWGLPDVIALAVGRHHNPMHEDTDKLSSLLWIADYIVSRLGYSCPRGSSFKVRESDLIEVMRKVGLNDSPGSYITDALMRDIKSSTAMWSEFKSGTEQEKSHVIDAG